MYEVSGEAVNQLVLQISILVFELTHREKEEKDITLADQKFTLVSIMTSLISIFFGLSTICLQKLEPEPSLGKKLKLVTCLLPDVLMRLLLIISIVLFSFRWRYGLITLIGILCLITIFAPTLISFLHSVIFKKKMLVMDRSLLVCPMFGLVDHNLAGDCSLPKKILQRSRMKNKFLGLMLSCAIFTFLWLAADRNIRLPLQDAW